MLLAASAFGGNDTSGWVIASLALFAGVLLFVLGVSLVRGRRPGRVAWLLVTGAGIVLLALPVDAARDKREAEAEAAPINRAVERAYMARSSEKNIEADCNVVFENPDGTEFWECIIESSTVNEICEVDIRRNRVPIGVVIGDCF